jgi:hypothetical protein
MYFLIVIRLISDSVQYSSVVLFSSQLLIMNVNSFKLFLKIKQSHGNRRSRRISQWRSCQLPVTCARTLFWSTAHPSSKTTTMLALGAFRSAFHARLRPLRFTSILNNPHRHFLSISHNSLARPYTWRTGLWYRRDGTPRSKREGAIYGKPLKTCCEFKHNL